MYRNLYVHTKANSFSSNLKTLLVNNKKKFLTGTSVYSFVEGRSEYIILQVELI